MQKGLLQGKEEFAALPCLAFYPYALIMRGNDGFGNKDGDIAFVAELNGAIVGAVWVRIMDDYGHIDDETPSFAISLLREYRGYGIGTELMRSLIKNIMLCYHFFSN